MGTPETYTHGHADAVLRSHRRRTVDNSAAYVAHRLVAGVSVLDVGCGPGTITVDIARRVAPGRVVGIDAAAEVVDEARAAALEAGVEIDLAVGAIYALDHPNDSFDVVHAHQVLQHLAEPVTALREMRRVCKPDGVVAVRDGIYRSFAWHPAAPGIDRWRAVYCAVAEANGGEPDAGTHLQAWALEAGFTRVTASATCWTYATDEDRTWWADLWGDRISRTALADRAMELGLASRAELDEMAAAWRAWADQPGACFVVPHGEVLASG